MKNKNMRYSSAMIVSEMPSHGTLCDREPYALFSNPYIAGFIDLCSLKPRNKIEQKRIETNRIKMKQNRNSQNRNEQKETKNNIGIKQTIIS